MCSLNRLTIALIELDAVVFVVLDTWLKMPKCKIISLEVLTCYGLRLMVHQFIHLLCDIFRSQFN